MEAVNSEFEIIVVGAGIMGSSTAYYLSKSFGKRILLLEQYDVVHRRGSSHGESRIIRRTYKQAHYTQLMVDAYKMWHDIESEAKTKLYTKTGGLDIGDRESEYLQEIIRVSKEFDVPCKLLEPAEVTKMFPPIKIPPNNIALYSPETGVLNATKSVVTLQRLAQQNGVTLLDNTLVTELVTKSNGLIQVATNHGIKYECKKLIITTGAWTGKLVQKLESVHLPLTPIETRISYYGVKNQELYLPQNFPTFVLYGEPILYGSPAIEYAGMIKVGADYGEACDPDSRKHNPEQLPSAVDAFLKNVLTDVETKPTLSESCMFTLSPDHDFIIDTLPTHPNILIGCGFSGHGFKLAPVVAKILVGILKNEHPYPRFQKYFTLKRFL